MEIGITDGKLYEERCRKERHDALDFMLKAANEHYAVDSEDLYASALKELLEGCVEVDQTEPPQYSSDFIEVRKICRIYSNLSRKEIEKCYGVRTFGIPYYGVFAIVDGLFASPSYKIKSGYKAYEDNPKYKKINFTDVPAGYRRDLVSVAMNGLFFPKESSFTNNFSRHYQIVFWDINDYSLVKYW